MTTLRGANTSAQWYYDDYPGGYFPRLEKFVIHTTETRGFPGYSGGASAPNATYDPRQREIRQHHPNNRSSRALRDPSGTSVRENRDGVFQLEIVCYSDYSLARQWGGLWVGDLTATHMEDIAKMTLQLHEEEGLPLNSTVRWREGQTTYVSGVRLSGPSFDSYKGILGHVHVSGNTHWDPGGFRYSKLQAAIQQLSRGQPPVEEEDDMPDKKTFFDWMEEYDTSARGRQAHLQSLILAVRGSDGLSRELRAVLQNIVKWSISHHELPKSAVEHETLDLGVSRLRRASRQNMDTLDMIVRLLAASGVKLDDETQAKIDQMLQDHAEIIAELDEAEEPLELYPQEENKELEETDRK